MNNASVPPNDMWGMLLYSMRYVVGRRSHSVADVCDWVRRYRKYLQPWQVKQIAEEIETELRQCESQGRTLGMDMDHKDWSKLVADLRA